MFLKRFVFVNWGNIPNTQFEFGPINLFSGGNGSGKTTAGDALQTIMTAAHEHLFHYNPGQEETTQRGRGGKRFRTLASYVLGCDDGSYARTEPSDAYLAAVFHPTDGETAPPFTALIGVRAWLDCSGSMAQPQQSDARFFILPQIELELSHLQREDGEGQYVVPLDQLTDLLVKEFGKRAVEPYDQKKPYLRRLYAALRGKSDSVPEREAVAAAKAFSRFMAYKPVNGINQFVADEILERKDLGEAIRSVSQQLKTIHSMEREAQHLKDCVAMLQQVQAQVSIYIDNWQQLLLLGLIGASHDRQQLQRNYLALKRQQQLLQEQEGHEQAELALTTKRLQQANNQIIQLEAQRLGIPALQSRNELQLKQQVEQGRLTELGRTLLIQDSDWSKQQQSVTALLQALSEPALTKDLPELASLEVHQLLHSLLEYGERGELKLTEVLQQGLDANLHVLEMRLDSVRHGQFLHSQMLTQWNSIDDGEGSYRDRVVALHDRRKTRYQHLTQQWQQKQEEITRLQNKQVRYPPYTEQALQWLRQKLPQAEVRVLCDHIEIKDSRWQAVIEGYVGGARFNLLVDAEHEAAAIRCLRQLPTRDHKARIIQGEKALRDAERGGGLPVDSIVHVMDFSHAAARAFFLAQYGAVVRVADAEALRKTARGVTLDGIGAGGYTMFPCGMPESDLVFGASARERALAAKQGEAEHLQIERNEASALMQQSTRLFEAITGLKPLLYADTMAELLDCRRRLASVELMLAQIDQSEFQSLDETLLRVTQDKVQWEQRQAALQRSSGAIEKELDLLASQLQTLSQRQDAAQSELDACEQRLRAGHRSWPEFDIEDRLRYADAEAEHATPDQLRATREQCEKLLLSSSSKMEQQLLEFNRICRPSDGIPIFGFDGQYDAITFHRVGQLHSEVDRVQNLLRNNVLVERHQQLQQVKLGFNNTFVAHLCHSIHNAIRDGERQIDTLNSELENHRFGADLERFRFDSEWVPEFRDYASFFKEVVDHPTLGEGTTLFEAELSNRSKAVREQLMAMLLSDDEQQAQRELERIADYRNYRRYEIFKEVEDKPPIPLSEYGTGSGGQLETPAYIIRAAAITSALRFNEGLNHLRMVLVDEAFSKMDESRSREVISYLTESLGLQLIFIMPTSKCGPFMDLISHEFVFAKVPSSQPRGQLHTRVLVDRKQCNREKIGALWAQHKRALYQQAEFDFISEVEE